MLTKRRKKVLSVNPWNASKRGRIQLSCCEALCFHVFRFDLKWGLFFLTFGTRRKNTFSFFVCLFVCFCSILILLLSNRTMLSIHAILCCRAIKKHWAIGQLVHAYSCILIQWKYVMCWNNGQMPNNFNAQCFFNVRNDWTFSSRSLFYSS